MNLDLFSNISQPTFWIVMAIVFAIVEAMTLGLTSLWFVMGALGAMVAAMLGAPFWLQVIIFAVLSAFFLMVTKPLAKNLLKIGGERTNADSLIGEKGLVTGKIEEFSMGQVKVKGQIWSALSEDGQPIGVNEQVEIKNIEGVKLIVEALHKPVKQPNANQG